MNAFAVAQYIKQKNPETVSLVCMGLMANKQTDEDNLCADYIKSLLEGKPLPDIYERMENLKRTSGTKFFDPERQHIFPQRDFELCTNLNTVSFVLRVNKDPNGLDYMERIDVL